MWKHWAEGDRKAATAVDPGRGRRRARRARHARSSAGPTSSATSTTASPPRRSPCCRCRVRGRRTRVRHGTGERALQLLPRDGAAAGVRERGEDVEAGPRQRDVAPSSTIPALRSSSRPAIVSSAGACPPPKCVTTARTSEPRRPRSAMSGVEARRARSGPAVIGPTAAISTRPALGERADVVEQRLQRSSAAASHSCGARRRGEQDGVDFAGGRRDDRAADDRLVGRRTPAVDREAHDVGARAPRTARRGRRRPSRGAARRCAGRRRPRRAGTRRARRRSRTRRPSPR